MNHHHRYMGLAACALALAACTGEGRAGSEPDAREEDESTAEASQAVLSATDADTLRFLEQATFGATPASLAAFNTSFPTGGQTGRMNSWMAAQKDPVQTPPSHYVAGGPNVQDQFFNFAVNGPDQLRQRVAFALSQILVTSLIKLKDDPWMVTYGNILIDGAFGNFKDLLLNVAESAAMGRYLDNANNFVVDTQTGSTTIAPNENFAREVMQLFSIGLCELNTNGTYLNGTSCESPYTQDNVEDFAHLMSGWTYDAPGGGACPTAGSKRSAANSDPALPMLACDGLDHDYTIRPLLSRMDSGTATYTNGTGFPSGSWTTRVTMENPLNVGTGKSGVIANLFHHPNVGPFIGKQLIQHLVTSNPSPEYIGRVADAFNGDATHGRGNLFSVVKAVLTDTEARSTTQADTFGHLREPVLYLTSLTRLFATTTDGTGLRKQSAGMGQDVLRSPSVFNYYPPNYPVPAALLPPGPTVTGGEFAIEDTNTAFKRANFVDALMYAPGSIGGQMTQDLTSMASLGTSPTATDIVDWCNSYMMHETMTQPMHDALVTAVSSGGLNVKGMKKRAIYLVATSAQFQIER